MNVNGNLSISGSATIDTNTLYVDPTNDRVGMGLTDPIYRLHVRDQGGNDPAVFEFNSSGGTPYINLRTSKGSYAAKTIVTSGDAFGIRAAGYDGANYQNIAALTFSVDGTPGIGDMPGRIGLWTSPDGSASMVEHIRVNQNGRIGIKTASRFHFDGLDCTGDTYILENASNDLRLFVGGTNVLEFNASAVGFAVDAFLGTTKKLFYDGGSDSYTVHSSSNIVDDYVGGVLQFRRTTSKGSFSDTLTVGHNPTDGSDTGAFSPFLTINAGEASRISTIDFRALGVQKGVMSYQHNATAANETFTFKVAGITSAFYIDQSGTKITSGTGISPSLFINAPTTSLDSNLSFMAAGVEKGFISYNHNATANLATLDFSVGGSTPLSIDYNTLSFTGTVSVAGSVECVGLISTSAATIESNTSTFGKAVNSAFDNEVLTISGSNAGAGACYGLVFDTSVGTLDAVMQIDATYTSSSAAGTYYRRIPIDIPGVGTKYIHIFNP